MVGELFFTPENSTPRAIQEAGFHPSFERVTYAVGLDLGQTHDPTAAVLESRQVPLPEIGADLHQKLSRPTVSVRQLWRFPLQTPYPAIVDAMAGTLARPQLRGNCRLIIDQTGVGRPVFDMFRLAGLRPVGVTITAGDGYRRDDVDAWHVSKLMLVSTLQALLHAGELKISRGLEEASALVSELQDFRANISDAGYASFGARVGKHDDLVLATAIAAWWLARRPEGSVWVEEMGM